MYGLCGGHLFGGGGLLEREFIPRNRVIYLKCGNVDIKVLYMILHEATNHHRIEETQKSCYKYKWKKKDYYFSFLKSCGHICKAYQSNALLQYMDVLAECGGGRTFIDW